MPLNKETKPKRHMLALFQFKYPSEGLFQPTHLFEDSDLCCFTLRFFRCVKMHIIL